VRAGQRRGADGALAGAGSAPRGDPRCLLAMCSRSTPQQPACATEPSPALATAGAASSSLPSRHAPGIAPGLLRGLAPHRARAFPLGWARVQVAGVPCQQPRAGTALAGVRCPGSAPLPCRGDIHQHHAEVLGVLRRPHEERDGVGAVRVESHQQVRGGGTAGEPCRAALQGWGGRGSAHLRGRPRLGTLQVGTLWWGHCLRPLRPQAPRSGAAPQAVERV